MNLKQLLETTRQQSSEIEMSNEQLVAEIQALDGTNDPDERKRLSQLQAKLFSQNAGLVVKVAKHYNGGKPPTQDETDELALAVFIAARKFDPTRGANFSACLPFYVRSALQKEHAFISGRSQAVYARAKAKLNNSENYSPAEVSRAEALLRSKKMFSEETDSRSIPSAEDLLYTLTGLTPEEVKDDIRMSLFYKAIVLLTERERAIVDAIRQPSRAMTEYGLSTNAAVARKLRLPRATVEIEYQRIEAKIQDYIAENEPSLAPKDWTPGQKGIQIPGVEGRVLGLWGTPTVEEVENYKKMAGKRRSPSHSKTERGTSGDKENHTSESDEQISAEDFFFAMREQISEETKRGKMLDLFSEAISLALDDEDRVVLASMFDSHRATNEYGLRTNEATAKNIHMDQLSVEVERQRIIVKIQDYVFEYEPSFRPPGWTNEQKGIQLPGMERFILGLFGTPAPEEVENYKKVAGKRHSAPRSKTERKTSEEDQSRASESDPENCAADEAKEQAPTVDLFSSVADPLDAASEEQADEKRTARVGRIRM